MQPLRDGRDRRGERGRPGERVERFPPRGDLPDEPAAADRALDIRAALDGGPEVIARPGQQHQQPDPVLTLELDLGQLVISGLVPSESS